MKLFTTILFTAAIVIFTSCERPRNCVCNVNGQQLTTELNEGAKADQEDACAAIENVNRLSDPNASCSLQ